MSFLGGGANLGTAYGAIVIGTESALRNINILGGALRASAAQAVESGRDYFTAGLMISSVGAAMQASFRDIISTGAEFDHQMSAVAATIGDLTVPQMEALHDEALQIGKDTSFTANEAGRAMESLAKAGVGAEDILSGVARSVADLAAATGTDLDTSATIMANAMNTFSLAGTDAAHVADVVTSALNESTATMSDLRAGLRAVGPVVANFGGTFEDAAAAIATFTNFGLKGADVGVSLARGLTLAARPTEEAAALMEELGIAVFDLQGKFIGFPALFDMLQKQMAGLSDQQREAALSMIFGAEAADVMSLAMAHGSDEYLRIRGEMDKTGTAAEAMSTRLDNLSGDVEKLRGSLETAEVQIFDELNPILRRAVQGLNILVDAFIELGPTVKLITGLILGLGGALVSFAGASLLFGNRIKAGWAALKELKFGIMLIPPQLRLLIKLVSILGLAFKLNFLGFRSLVMGAVDGITSAISKLKKAWGPVRNIFDFITQTGARKIQRPNEAAFLETMVSQLRALGLSQHSAKATIEFLKDIHGPLRTLQQDFKIGKRLGSEFFEVIGGGKLSAKLARDAKTLFGDVIGQRFADATFQIRHSLQDLRKEFKKSLGFDPADYVNLDKVLLKLNRSFRTFSHFIHGTVVPLLGRVLVNVLKGVNAVIRGLIFGVNVLGKALNITGIILKNTLVGAFQLFSKLIRGDIRGAIDLVVGWFKDLSGGVADLAEWVLDVAAPKVIMWASDAWAWLVETAFPWLKGQVADLKDWVLDVAVPTLIGWATTIGRGATALWDWMVDQFTALSDFAGEITDWVLNVLEPEVTGWLKDKGGDVWAWIQEKYGDFSTFAGKVSAWILDVPIPFITGKVLTIAGDMWAFISGAFSGLKDLTGEITAWTLEVALPFITGPVTNVAGDMWAFVSSTFTGLTKLTGEITAWTLEVALPFVTGPVLTIVDDVWAWLKGIYPNITKIVGDIKSWTLNVAKPFITGDVVNFAADMWAGIKNAIPKIGTVLGEIKAWTLDVAAPFITGPVVAFATRIWQELQDRYPGFKTVVGEIKRWTLNVAAPSIGNLVSDIGSWIQGWLDKHPSTRAQLRFWLLEIDDPNDVHSKDPTDAVQKEVNKYQRTTVLLYKWYLTLTEPNAAPQSDKQIEQATQVAMDKLKGKIRAKLSFTNILLANPQIKAIVDINDSLNQFLNDLEPVRAKLDKWNIDLGQVFVIGGPSKLASDIGLRLRKDLGIAKIEAGAIDWILGLKPPSISFGAGGGAGGFLPSVGFDIGDSIRNALKKLGDISVPWPSEFVIGFPQGSMKIKIPSWDDIFNGLWSAIKALGDINLSWPNSWGIHFGLPNIGLPSMTDISTKIFSEVRKQRQAGGGGGEFDANMLFGNMGDLNIKLGKIDLSNLNSLDSKLDDVVKKKTNLETFKDSIISVQDKLSAMAGKDADDGLTKLSTAISGIGTAIKGALLPNLAQARAAVTNAVSAMITAFRSLQSAVRGIMATIASDIQNRLRGALETAKSVVSNSVNAMIASFRTLATAARAEGQRAGDQFREGLQAGMSGSSSDVRGAIANIRGAFTTVSQGAWNAGYQAGAALGDGLVDGLNSRIQAVRAASSFLANIAKAAFDAASKSSSPSKVWYDMGQNLVDGLVNALTDGQSAVTSATRDLFGATLDQPFSSMTMTSAMVPTTAAVAGAGVGNTYINNIEKVSLEEAKDLLEWGEFVNNIGVGRSTVIAGT